MKLHNYQKKGIDFWLSNPRTYYAIDMGLGKTAIGLHGIQKINKPFLVVGPLRPVYTTWPDEILKWNLPFRYSIVYGVDKYQSLNRKSDIYLTNFHSIPFVYNYLVDLVKKKKPFPFSGCIIDEGSMIKAPKSQRLDYLEALRTVFPKYRAILSGTPAPNSLLDLWSQYYWLCDGNVLGMRYNTFRSKYFEADPWNPYQWELRPGAKDKIYKAIAPYTYRLDEKDHLSLPPISYNYISLSLSKKLRKLYNEFKKEFLVNINNVDHTALNSATLSQKLRQFLQGFIYYDTDEVLDNGKYKRAVTEFHKTKLKTIQNLIEELNQPILCAIQFRHELEMFRSIFSDVPVIAGKTKNSDAVKYIKQWNRGELPLLVCHPASLSHGTNLQSHGHNIVWYCQTWSLEQYQQLNKRLHRQGQKHGVVIHHLVIKNTIDDKITKVLAKKDITQRDLLDYLRDITNYN